MILSFVTGKGGAGKSTLSVNVACQLALDGHRVALIDTDPQRTVIDWDYARSQLADSRRAYALPYPDTIDHTHGFKGIPLGYDHIVIDTPGRIKKEMYRVIDASDVCIVPIQPSALDVWGAEDACQVIQARQRAGGIVITMQKSRTTIAQEIAGDLKHLGLPVLRSRIGLRAAYTYASDMGSSVVHAYRTHKAADEIRALTKEILRRWR